MAAPTVTFPTGSANRLTALFVSDGTTHAYTITQADIVTALGALKIPNTGTPGEYLDDMKPTAPIVTALTTAIAGATQAQLRAATIDGPVKMSFRPRSGAAPAAAANAFPYAVDVDTDAGTPTKIEINVQYPEVAGDFYLDIIVGYSASDGPNCTL